MKKIFGKFCLGGVFLIGLSMSLTSCEGALDDILGEWSRPVPGGGSSSDEPTTTMKATPLTMEAITAGTIVVKNPQAGMQYSLNGGAKTAVTTDAITVAIGDKVQFYGKGTEIAKYSGTQITGGTAEVKVYGNIMSLVDETGFATNKKLTSEQTFRGLFNNNVKLKDASGLLLPAETLATSCYSNMFYGCEALTAAPAELPATSLANYCYSGMFFGCKALTAAPELKAETLANSCYSKMFQNCKALTAAPELKAETLANNCYESMFQGCTSLTAAPELKAQTLADRCYLSMFWGCTGLTAAPELKAQTLANNCYESMFRGCTSLTTAPALPVTALAKSCYYAMFRDCTALTNAYVKAAYTTANGECSIMFDGCGALGAKLHTSTASKTSWEGQMGSGHPWNNWTVEDNY